MKVFLFSRNTFAARALRSPLVVHSVSRLICKCEEKQTEAVEHGSNLVETASCCSQSARASSKSSDDAKYRKHANSKSTEAETILENKNEPNERRPKLEDAISSSNRSLGLSVVSPPTQSDSQLSDQKFKSYKA